ncbi:hypothetical protein OUZ56_004932 [Daphnia magna]|uniref:Uncharacterized protein n=1 Tax=Daphnia magna TaxID=35525 RepID=A0ABQ9YRA2_9CRUS|nr:hypothetical protein OUZ56_004932 [Daphnia magna]
MINTIRFVFGGGAAGWITANILLFSHFGDRLMLGSEDSHFHSRIDEEFVRNPTLCVTTLGTSNQNLVVGFKAEEITMMSRSLQCRTHGPSQYKNGQANHHNHHNRFSLNEWQVKKDERGQTMGGKNQKKKMIID